MIVQSLFYLMLPVVILTGLFGILWLWLSSYKFRKLPNAIGYGFTGSQYLLTRGRAGRGITDLYYDIDVSITDNKKMSAVADWYLSIIHKIIKNNPAIDRIAFIEKDSGPVGTIMLLGLLVEKCKLPAIIVRLRRRLSINSVKGYEVKKGLNVILASDVITSGGSLKNAIQKLLEVGIHVKAAIFLISRMDDVSINGLEKELGINIDYAWIVKDKSDLEKYPIKTYLSNKLISEQKGDLQGSP